MGCGVGMWAVICSSSPFLFSKSPFINFQTNFRKIRPNKQITVGNKTLKFIKIIDSKKMKLEVTPVPVDVREQYALELATNGSLPEDETAEVMLNKQGLLV